MKTTKFEPGMYEGNHSQLMARVVHEASMDGPSAETGDVTEWGLHAALVIGKRYSFVILEDSMGFVDVESYPNAIEATVRFQFIEAEYGLFLDRCDS